MKNKDEFEYGSFGRTAKDFFKHSDAFINIAHGSVRSGKTIICNARFLRFIAESSNDEFIISGKTLGSVNRNVIKPLIKIANGEDCLYEYHRGNSELIIEDNTCYVLGFKDEASQDIIAGMTVGGWLADEITRCPQSAVEMAISRCSLPDSKMFWNMNPDSPYHYIYTNYINNQNILDKGIVKCWHFTIEDNPNLSKEYVANLKESYKNSPLFYKRNILGEWVIAEGSIYDMFLESENTFKKIDLNSYDCIDICCDYGVSTVTTFGVMARKYDTEKGNTYYLLEETYYDAEVEGVAQSDTERIETLLQLQNKYDLNKKNTIYLPHDATSLKTACEKDSRILMNVETYTPDTYEDIKNIQTLIGERRFLIHESCKNSISQAQTYCWDKKAQKKGEDKPLKINDHCPDMWRGGIFGHRSGKKAKLGVVFL